MMDKERYEIIGTINKECDLCETNMNNNVIQEKGRKELFVRCVNHTPKELK